MMMLNMKKEPLFHPRVFDTPDSAESYYKQNLKNQKRYAKDTVKKIKELGFKEGRILDAGCGYGFVAVELAKAFPKAEIVGIDLSDPLLKMARSLASDAGVSERVLFEKQDVQDIQYPDDSFDAVLNLYMFHIVEDPKKMVEEIDRVLTPNGILYLRDLRRSWLGYFSRIIKTAYTLEEAKRLLKGSKLRPCKFKSSLLDFELESSSGI